MIVLLFALGVVLELMMYALPLLWARRRALAPLILGLVSFAGGWVLAHDVNLAGALFFIVTLFRAVNLLRISEARMHPFYLRRVTCRSALFLAGAQGLSLLALEILGHVHVDAAWWWLLATAAQVATATAIFTSTLSSVRRTRFTPPTEFYSDKELPTVTVAIPARNETDDLEACLRSVIANDYPKLEILVLDDCSQDRTADIIKGFAHDGVRFVQGDEPAERWLAKNQAYAKLAHEASGELILFCGVDVRFGPDTIRALVTNMLNRKKAMISVMPLRTTGSMINALVQPTRYWWELAIPRTLVNRPPVLSTCWLIDRKRLAQLGGFAAVSHTIIPEGFFAREFIKTNEYSFVRADERLDVQTRKKPADQRDTAIRMNYPKIRRRLEMAMALTLIDLGLLLAPLGVFMAGFWVDIGLAQWLAAMASLLLIATHVLIVQVSNPPNTSIAILNYPVAVLVELILGLTSMWKYEFSTVDWKGRNICIPVMHVIPKLPPIDQQPTEDSGRKS